MLMMEKMQFKIQQENAFLYSIKSKFIYLTLEQMASTFCTNCPTRLYN